MIILVSQETIKTFVTGLKEAGINLVVSLPCTAHKHFLPSIMSDPHFTHIPIANEDDGMGICAGAWMGGKKPVFLLEVAGLLLGTYALFKVTRYWGGAMLLVIDNRGDFGDGAGNWYAESAAEAERILESFKIPYTKVWERDKLIPELVRGQRTAEGFGRPAAVLLSMEELWDLT